MQSNQFSWLILCQQRCSEMLLRVGTVDDTGDLVHPTCSRMDLLDDLLLGSMPVDDVRDAQLFKLIGIG